MAMPPEDAARDEHGVLSPVILREAVSAATTIAAPLLAGFAFTGVILVVQASSAVRYPSPTLVVLAVAVVALIMAVQCGFWALLNIKILEERLNAGADVVTAFSDPALAWVRAARVLYDSGILLLLAGLTLVLLPEDQLGGTRVLASAASAIGFLVELAWVAWTFRRRSGLL